MTPTVSFTMKRFKFHLELRNKCKALDNTNGCIEEAQKTLSKHSSKESWTKSLFQPPPSRQLKQAILMLASDTVVSEESSKKQRGHQKAKQCKT
ncbi:hypothetical protein G6F70_004273 [Rhizopus microsporus]|nr:hypothetical protein G6F71_000161 [Rhizopus microsporus]KAG1200159.1 hypothetical protein G6F70_004273 [Rhizopus microsporus]KAG1214995.1 hypothetical protein G6F69_001396 [Rhizopus microsporus]KAG1225985.1 hypothetical protein G6F67_009153 [Rhizopus microsporus]KAG1257905.1 hypothetical protein G6F68_009072 [Rhizopus microsporus]